MHIRQLLMQSAAVCLAVGTAHAADVLEEAPPPSNPAVHVWTGISYAPHSIYGYVGGIVPLNGDLYADGFQVRGEAAVGRYDYDGDNGKNEVDQRAFDAMAGYHWNWNTNALSFFAGLNYQDFDNPEEDDEVDGDEFGLKVQGEIYSPFSDKWYGYALANYSTAFETYYGSAKTLYRFTDKFALGPEVTALGNEGFDQVRAGGTAAIGLFEIGEAIVGVGHAWTARDADDGVYANLHLRFAF